MRRRLVGSALRRYRENVGYALEDAARVLTFRPDFRVFGSETGFEFDICEFESFWGSHPVSSLCRTSVRQKCLRYFRRLAPGNRSLSCGICSNSTFIRDFLSPVSNRQFSISEIRSRRLGSHLAETGSMSAIRRILLQNLHVFADGVRSGDFAVALFCSPDEGAAERHIGTAATPDRQPPRLVAGRRGT